MVNSNGKTLLSLVKDIKRGNITNLDLKKTGLPYFHTTDFKNFDGILQSQNNRYDALTKQPILAQKVIY